MYDSWIYGIEILKIDISQKHIGQILVWFNSDKFWYGYGSERGQLCRPNTFISPLQLKNDMTIFPIINYVEGGRSESQIFHFSD